MIRAAVGLSIEPNAARAALEAAGQVVERLGGTTPDFAIACLSSEHAEHLTALLEALASGLGTPYVTGSSSSGVLVPGREIESGPFVAVLGVVSDALRATPFLFHDVGDQGISAGLRLGQRLSGSRGSNDVVVVWPDALRVRPDRLLASLDAVLGDVPVVGGAASAGVSPDTFQFCGTESTGAAVAGLRLGGAFRHVVGVTQGCRPLGAPLRVTRSHENLILEIESRPAFDVLRERAPAGLLDDLEWALHFLFVGLVPEPDAPQAGARDFLVRNIVAADADTGVLAVADAVEEGQHLVFALREAASARGDLERMSREVSSERTGIHYRFGLYFNCLARGRSLYGESGVDAAILARAHPDVPILGFSCNAEIGPLHGVNRLFTYTGVLLLVGP